jgi:ribonucleotide reductase beta subunit family protein with ferritin-like domain
MYKRAEASFWTAEEFDPASDLIDWNERMTEEERYFVTHILAFFAGADGVVNENLCANFAVQVQLYEARAFYGFQIAMEQIHSETYGLLIDAYVRDVDQREHLFSAMESIPCVRQKIAWALRWISDKEVGFAERLIAFATIEGVFFSGAFCAIFWLKKRGLMPGLTFTNELIARDENMHCEFACLLYSKLEHKVDASVALAIVCEAVAIETEFVCTSLPVRLIGMNSESMSQYIRFVADRLLTQLGYESHYNVTNPYEFMELQSLEGKTNFFEKRVGDYQKAGVLTGNRNFEVDNDF